MKRAEPAEKSHKAAEHIEEVARLANSVGPDKTLENVRKDANCRTQPPPEEDLGGGDICSLEAEVSTDDDKPLD
jgi:hypothetical protein